MKLLRFGQGVRQLRSRYIWLTWGNGRATCWLCIGGRRPQQPYRRLRVPSIRWKLFDLCWRVGQGAR